MQSNTKLKFLRILLILAILGSAVLLALYLINNKKTPQAEPQDIVVPLVEVLEIAPDSVRFNVLSQGTVEPAIETQITSEISGTITAVPSNFAAGYSFSANDTLVQIDPTLFRAARDEARAILRQRQIEYEGIRKLDASNYRSKIDLVAAEAALASAQAALVGAENNLSKTRIRIPYDGIVRSREINVGQFVSPGTRIGTVFGSDRVEIRLPLSQNDIKFLDLPRTGQREAAWTVPIQLNGNYRGVPTVWSGQIVRTEAALDPNNRVSYAVAEVLDPYLQESNAGHLQPLPVGTFVNATIPGRYLPNVIAIPRRALRGNGQLVFVDNENTLRVRTVEVIRTDADMAYINASSITERHLVLTNLEAPVNGQTVRVKTVQKPVPTLSSPQSVPPGVSPRLPSLQLDQKLSTEADAQTAGAPF